MKSLIHANLSPARRFLYMTESSRITHLRCWQRGCVAAGCPGARRDPLLAAGRVHAGAAAAVAAELAEVGRAVLRRGPTHGGGPESGSEL